MEGTVFNVPVVDNYLSSKTFVESGKLRVRYTKAFMTTLAGLK